MANVAFVGVGKLINQARFNVEQQNKISNKGWFNYVTYLFFISFEQCEHSCLHRASKPE